MAYNVENNIVPKALNKSLDNALAKNSVSTYHFEKEALRAAEPDLEYLDTPAERENNSGQTKSYGESGQRAQLHGSRQAKGRNKNASRTRLKKENAANATLSLTN